MFGKSASDSGETLPDYAIKLAQVVPKISEIIDGYVAKNNIVADHAENLKGELNAFISTLFQQGTTWDQIIAGINDELFCHTVLVSFLIAGNHAAEWRIQMLRLWTLCLRPNFLQGGLGIETNTVQPISATTELSSTSDPKTGALYLNLSQVRRTGSGQAPQLPRGPAEREKESSSTSQNVESRVPVLQLSLLQELNEWHVAQDTPESTRRSLEHLIGHLTPKLKPVDPGTGSLPSFLL